MKKETCFLALIFLPVLLNIGCKKNSSDTANDQTLEQKYPDWKNLTWVSTNGNSTQNTYPKISFSIVGNVVNFTYIVYIAQYNTGEVTYHFKYDGFNLTSTTATLTLPESGSIVQTFNILTPPDNSKIKVTWNDGLTNDTYILQKN